MGIIIKMYLIAFVVFFLIDMIWLGFLAKGFYDRQLGYIRSERINWIAAILFYFLYIGALVFFVIHPAVEKQSYMYAWIVGMVFGFITYATYDLTNLATIKDWPLLVTIVDIAWGTVLVGIVSIVTTVIMRVS